MQLNVSLPPRMYEFVQDKVKSGMYSDPSEIIQDALRRFNEKELDREAWQTLNSLLANAKKSGKSTMSVKDIARDIVAQKAL